MALACYPQVSERCLYKYCSATQKVTKWQICFGKKCITKKIFVTLVRKTNEQIQTNSIITLCNYRNEVCSVITVVVYGCPCMPLMISIFYFVSYGNV